MAKNKKNLESLSFKDFQIEQIIFELRYFCEQAYSINFQKFWREIQSRLKANYNRIKLDEPTIVNYNRDFEIQVFSDKFGIVQLFPKSSTEEFLNVSQIFYDVTNEVLEIEEITRAGLRVIYSKDYDSPELVAEALFETTYINRPSNLYLENGKMLIPNLAMGWRDDGKGITYRLKGNSGTIGLDLPLVMINKGNYPERIEEEFHQMILDIDIFIYGHILPGQFFLDEWVKQAYETVKEEGLKFFGEK